MVVYKVDRLSRSLLDFSRLVERFEKRRVAFVSITQHFDTSTSMGRLVFHILLSFAQFERELISERTRNNRRCQAPGEVDRRPPGARIPRRPPAPRASRSCPRRPPS